MVRPSALFLSPRLNQQLVDQKRVGVLQMIDESSPVLAQYFRQDAGVNDLLVQHIKLSGAERTQCARCEHFRQDPGQPIHNATVTESFEG